MASLRQLTAGRAGTLAALVLCWVLGWSLPQRIMAQQDVQTSMYWAVPTLYNPATAGCDSALHVTAFDRMQWVGVHGAPKTLFVSADMPYMLKRKRVGAGICFVNDKAGLFTTTQVGLQGDVSLSLWGGRLALGLQAGMINQGFESGEVHIPDGDAWDASDESLPTGDVSAMAFDLGLGAYYEREWLTAGLGIQHLGAETIDLDDYAFTEIERTFYFHLGGNIPISRTLFFMQPSLLVKSTLRSTQIDYTLRMTYDQRLWGGISYRHGDAVVLMVGANVNSVRLGYAYDIGISPLAKAAHGSHEIMATYTLQIDLGKKAKHRHKSIRIL